MNRLAMALLSLALLAVPLAAEAQGAGKVFRIGQIYTTPADADDLFNPEKYSHERALAQGLAEHGYIVGKNVVIEAGPVKGRHEGPEAFAAELVRLKVDLIYLYTCGRRQLLIARQITIPIVVGACNDDLVASGVVKSLARPGGNITGLSKLSTELTAKRLEMLKEVVPKASRVAVLWNPDYMDFASDWRAIRGAAQALGVTLYSVEARGVNDIDRAFTAMLKERPDALVTFSDTLVWIGAKKVAELSAQHRLPAMHAFREVPDAGGLMAYGPNLLEMYRRSAKYVDNILKGAKPGDLPIEQATKFELVINLNEWAT